MSNAKIDVKSGEAKNLVLSNAKVQLKIPLMNLLYYLTPLLRIELESRLMTWYGTGQPA